MHEIGRPVRVFVSYANEDDAVKERVTELVTDLRSNGIDARFDRDVHGTPPEGWPQWLEDQIAAANYVLAVCTQTYRHRYDQLEQPQPSKGAAWEGLSLRRELSSGSHSADKFAAVLFDPMDEAYILPQLNQQVRYVYPQNRLALLRWLTGQPAYVPARLGHVPVNPPFPNVGKTKSRALPRVFIASSREGLPIAEAVADNLTGDAIVQLWTRDLTRLSDSVGQRLEELASDVDAAIFVATDAAISVATDAMHEVQSSLRANVVFELGFLVGRLGYGRVFLVVDDDANLPADMARRAFAVTRVRSRTDGNLVAAVGPAVAAIRHQLKVLTPIKDRASDYHSCFISYASEDEQLAVRLYNDLRMVGVRCWFAMADMQAGRRVWPEIERAISNHDKMLVVLSQASITRPGVRHEIRAALDAESRRREIVLFPIRIDNAVLHSNEEPFRSLVADKHIGDFTDWTSDEGYRRAFSRLVRDLAIANAVEVGERGNA